jgi:hypothetical protein
LPIVAWIRWCAIVLTVALVTGCAEAGGAASPTPINSASPSSSPAVGAIPPCRMPVNLRVDQGGNREVLGYLALPSGTTVDDPTDAIVKVADYPVGSGVTVPVWGTTTSPQLFGVALGTHSSTANRWLPAPPELVSPDGRHYTYLHPNGSLRLSAADGTEIPIPNPTNLTPLAFTSSGVVLVENGPASNGIWLLDPTTQNVTAVTPPAGTDDWREVTGTVAFGLDSPGVLGAPPPTVVLTTSVGVPGNPKAIYTVAPGNSVAFIAADRQGGVLIGVSGAAPGLVYLNGGIGPTAVSVPQGVVVATIGPRHHADGFGIWFLSSTGIFLFNASSGFRKVAPGATSDVAPGGDCVYPN